MPVQTDRPGKGFARRSCGIRIKWKRFVVNLELANPRGDFPGAPARSAYGERILRHDRLVRVLFAGQDVRSSNLPGRVPQRPEGRAFGGSPQLLFGNDVLAENPEWTPIVVCL